MLIEPLHPLFCLQGVDCLTKSCDLNNDKACFYLHGMYMVGAIDSAKALNANEKPTPNANDKILPKNLEKAFAFAYKACELKNALACSNVSRMYAKGEGTQKNEEMAKKFAEMSANMRETLNKNAFYQHRT